MTATGHAVIGLALAAAIPNPFIGIPVAFVSHIAADAFPHWDTGTNLQTNNPMSKKTKTRFIVESCIDLCLSFLIPYLLLITLFSDLNLIYVFAMIIAAQGFDWLTAPYVFLNWKFPPFTWFAVIQKSFDQRLDKPWGIILQVAILSLLLLVAKTVS